MNSTQHYHVASGSYYISRQKPLILDAYLGTCVGVALCDEKSGVGGLIHLLLPEPVSLGDSHQPEKYASTGFPVFLRALYDEGASKKHLKAYVAGGALVGPIESVDLKLDIGGRTVDTVLNFLKDEHIQIERSETGGFFTSCLSLNLESWHCRIEPVGSIRNSPDRETHVPTVEEIEQSIEALQPIPPMTHV